MGKETQKNTVAPITIFQGQRYKDNDLVNEVIKTMFSTFVQTNIHGIGEEVHD